MPDGWAWEFFLPESNLHSVHFWANSIVESYWESEASGIFKARGERLGGATEKEADIFVRQLAEDAKLAEKMDEKERQEKIAEDERSRGLKTKRTRDNGELLWKENELPTTPIKPQLRLLGIKLVISKRSAGSLRMSTRDGRLRWRGIYTPGELNKLLRKLRPMFPKGSHSSPEEHPTSRGRQKDEEKN